MGPLVEHCLPHLAGPAPAALDLQPLREDLLARPGAAWSTVELSMIEGLGPTPSSSSSGAGSSRSR